MIKDLSKKHISILGYLFLLSGSSAIIYQIAWQRTLYTSFGINIESITMIVSIFMFGLGMGSLLGGQLSKKFPNKLPFLFLICEIVIGLFGLVSISLIKQVSIFTLHASPWSLAIIIYGLLAIPTLAMGATLPILVFLMKEPWHFLLERLIRNLKIINLINL